MSTPTYRGYTIQPKRDFGPHGYIGNGGRVIKSGFVVCNRAGSNIMPGATWFETVPQAKEAIDVLIRVRGCSEKFWEVMQPFEYRKGQVLPKIGNMARNGTAKQGRWSAEIVDGVVVSVTKVPWSKYPHHNIPAKHWKP